MKLEVGMYVRTKYNDFCNMVTIRKIEKIDEEDNKFWIDDYIVDTYGDEQNKLCEEDILKASHNIIDLIEVGDYVNGYKITLIYNEKLFTDEYLFDDVEGEFNRIYFKNSDIKSIVTKEQFESMRYVVNENS